MRARCSLVAAVAIAACAGARPPPPPPPTPIRFPVPVPEDVPANYFPLAIGNSWTFLQSSAGQETPVHHTVRIVRRDTDGYYVDDQQGALRVDEDCLRDRIRRLLCGPLEAGTTWTSTVSPTVTERSRIVAVGESVAVPAGTFPACIRVRSQARVEGVQQVAELTYARGVGLIRLETYTVVNGTATRQIHGELESYRVAPEVR